MKKALSFILVAVMLLALAVPAFAADNVADETTGAGKSEGIVTAEFDEGSDVNDAEKVAKTYLVTVDWTIESTLKYSNGTTTYTWNTDDTKYESSTAGKGWTGEADVAITVTNKSNDAITAKATWAAAEGITAACEFDKTTIDVESAAKGVEVADGAEGSAKTGEIKASVATPTEGTISENNATVGTITVAIAAAE